jgi:hypothetical protein
MKKRITGRRGPLRAASTNPAFLNVDEKPVQANASGMARFRGSTGYPSTI